MRAGFGLLVVLFLLIGVGGGAAFGGGVLYGRNTAPKAKAALTTAAAAPGSAAPVSQNVAGGGGTPAAGGRGQGGGGGAGGTAGAIDSVSGSTLTVRTLQGASTTVTLSADTRILTTTAATRDDLKPGSTVTVLGQPDAAGAIAATSITIIPSGLSSAPQGGGGQGTPGGQRGQGARPSATP